jgi:hypothetical protein
LSSTLKKLPKNETFSSTAILGLILAGFIPSLNRIYKKDINTLTAEQWKGRLSYLDYSSIKRNTIPSNLIVEQSKFDKNTWYFKNDYPKEPHENSIDGLYLGRVAKG